MSDIKFFILKRESEFTWDSINNLSDDLSFFFLILWILYKLFILRMFATWSEMKDRWIWIIFNIMFQVIPNYALILFIINRLFLYNKTITPALITLNPTRVQRVFFWQHLFHKQSRCLICIRETRHVLCHICKTRIQFEVHKQENPYETNDRNIQMQTVTIWNTRGVVRETSVYILNRWTNDVRIIFSNTRGNRSELTFTLSLREFLNLPPLWKN